MTKTKGQPLHPTTTVQEDLTVAGQRRINLIWEYTQSAIAVVVVTTTMASGIYSMLTNTILPTIISVAFGTVIGYYFARTNHQAIGGIGPKATDTQPYVGR